jgi:hypothetical protein
MQLRVGMIRAFGPREGDPALDPAVIARWFFDSLPMAWEEASAKAKNWKLCPIEDIRALAKIKDHASIVNDLCNTTPCVVEPELQAWLSLVPDLP